MSARGGAPDGAPCSLCSKGLKGAAAGDMCMYPIITAVLHNRLTYCAGVGLALCSRLVATFSTSWAPFALHVLHKQL
jgi:hypothetical protein